MKCPNCQTELPDNAKFCGACGQLLQTERKCPRCGHINSQMNTYLERALRHKEILKA
jgi:predicted amidophosphoribosyltransferase